MIIVSNTSLIIQRLLCSFCAGVLFEFLAKTIRRLWCVLLLGICKGEGGGGQGEEEKEETHTHSRASKESERGLRC